MELADDPRDYAGAAKHAGVQSAEVVRHFLEYPHVMRYRRNLKHFLTETIAAQNPVILGKIAAESQNDAATLGYQEFAMSLAELALRCPAPSINST